MVAKKLLVVSTSFPLIPGDSLSPFMLEFCNHLIGLGWEVKALVPHRKGLPETESWGSLAIHRFRYMPEKYEDLGYSGGIMPNIRRNPLKIFKLPFYVFAMYREALRLAVSEGYNLVNFHWLFPASFWLGQFARSSRVPAVLTGHGTDILLASKGVFKFFADRAFKYASGVTVNSEYMKNILRHNRLPEIAEVIPMGVDIEKFAPAGNSPSQSKTIVYIGRLIEQKGVSLLVEAFFELVKKIPDARLEIIGYGPEKENINCLIKSSGLSPNIRLVDAVPHDELPQIYRNARILALPALIPEGLGLTPIEAGLCGVPTVTFGLGGTSEIVLNGQTGIVAEPSSKGLYEALMRLMQDDELTDNLGANARAFLMKKIGWHTVAEKFDRLFTAIIEKKSGTANFGISKKSAIISSAMIVAVTAAYIIKLFIDRFERLLGLFQ
jgi:glycosyltransferase involved in cell wall biosynthesis